MIGHIGNQHPNHRPVGPSLRALQLARGREGTAGRARPSSTVCEWRAQALRSEGRGCLLVHSFGVSWDKSLNQASVCSFEKQAEPPSTLGTCTACGTVPDTGQALSRCN